LNEPAGALGSALTKAGVTPTSSAPFGQGVDIAHDYDITNGKVQMPGASGAGAVQGQPGAPTSGGDHLSNALDALQTHADGLNGLASVLGATT
jgi:hypothetical protein